MSGFQPEDEVSITSIRSGVCGNLRVCDEHTPTNWPVRLKVRTLLFQGRNSGALPGRATK
jgi:hypothetical protein